MRVPPSGYAAIEHIECKSRGRQRRGGEKMRQRLAADIDHGAEYAGHAAGCVGQREQIGQVHAADHREMFARLAGVWSHAESLIQRGRNRGFFFPRIWFLGLPLLVGLFLYLQLVSGSLQ